MKRDLTQGPIGGHMIKLTLPMAWGIFAILTFSLADVFFIAQFSTEALTVFSFTIPVVAIYTYLSLGLGVGVSSVIARAAGSKDHKRVCELTSGAVTLSLMLGLILAATGYLMADFLFPKLGVPLNLMPMLHEYMNTWYIGFIFLVVSMTCNSTLRGRGNTLTPSLVMTFAAALNIALDPILIFGLWGAPRLGLHGAALATAISYASSMLVWLYMLIWNQKVLLLTKNAIKTSLPLWKPILQVAIPASVANMIYPLIQMISIKLIADASTSIVAGFGVATRIQNFAMIPMFAMAASMGPFMGQNWGAKEGSRMHQALRIAYMFCCVWGLFLTVFFLLGAETISSFFTDDAAVIRGSSIYLTIIPIGLLGYGVATAWESTLNGIGKPAQSLMVAILEVFVLFMPMAFLGDLYYGPEGVFAAITASSLATGAICYLWSKRLACPN